MSANSHQVGGTHYAKNAIQPWDYIVKNNIGYLEGNVIKYIARAGKKEPSKYKEDLQKAMVYLQKRIDSLDK